MESNVGLVVTTGDWELWTKELVLFRNKSKRLAFIVLRLLFNFVNNNFSRIMDFKIMTFNFITFYIIGLMESYQLEM